MGAGTLSGDCPRPQGAFYVFPDISVAFGKSHNGRQIANGVEVQQQIRITDDGRGIARDDLPLALARHATSKIATLDDLERVVSLGFRGEALASIAAISHLTLTSRTEGDAHAWRIEADAGRFSPPEPAAAGFGTTLEVREIYYNTPARRKFLRTENTELAHCEETFTRIALSRPDVALTLQHNGRALQRLPVHAFAQRVSALLGEEFAAASMALDHGTPGLRLHGLIASPSFNRMNALVV